MTRNHRRSRPQGRRSRPKQRRGFRWGIALITVFVFVFLVATGATAAFLFDTLKNLPKITDFRFEPAQTSFILDQNGEVITKVPSTENRIVVDLDDIPEMVREAFIAVEDERFRSHIGVDIYGIARALINDLRGGEIQGASTITQQLVRNVIPLTDSQDIADNLEVSITRKIREAVLAIELERRYTKDEILEMYLNQINFGHSARGIEAAARLYFGKSIGEVNIPETAMLAALPKGPNTYSPLNNPDLARQRRNVVLAKMLEKNIITQEEYEQAIAVPIEDMIATSTTDSETTYPYPYFVDYVIENVIHDLGAEKVRSGGLRIITTLDRKVQEAAERALREVLDKDFPLSPDKKQPEAAVVLIDNHTGAIKAMVGGRRHTTVLGLNRAWHKPWSNDNTGLRQPGSALKPLSVYLPALSNGMTTATVVDDAPKIYASGGTGQHVIENYDNRYTGLITLREAARRSVNTATARLLELVGPDTSWNFLQRLGIKTLTDADRDISPLALGGLTRGVSVLNMAEAYAVIANGGTHIEPFAISEIRDANGRLVKSYEPVRQAVLDPKVAYVMTDTLRSVVEPQGGAYNINSGTGASARINGWQVAGKTGTTEQTRDAWFVGYTPLYTAAVWMGYDQPTPMGSSVCGGCYPAPIWKIVMEAALEGKEPVPFPRPEGIVNRNISIKSGKLAAPETPSNMIRNELFVLGTEPTEFDDAFEVAAVCKEDPTLLYEDSCGCEREEKVFLKRPIITVEDMIPVARAAGKGQDWAARFVPEDMKLAMPEQSCREAIDPSWDHAQGGNSGSFQPDGSFAIEIEIGRGQFNPVWYTVPAHTPVRMTLRSVDEETHRIRYESSLARPDSGTVELNGRRSRTLTFEAIEQGIITVYCEEHPGEQMRIVIGPPLEQGDPPDERRDERRNDDDNGSDNPGDEDDDDHDDNDEEDDTDDDQSDS